MSYITDTQNDNIYKEKEVTMKFLEVFREVQASPVMLLAEVLHVSLKPNTNTMIVQLEVPYEFTESEKEDVAGAISSAYGGVNVKVEYKVKAFDKKESPVIYGRAIKEPVIEKISNIDRYYGKVTIQGQIINTDERETKKGKILYKFDVTDKSSSITCKLILSKDDAERILPELKKGKYITLSGEAGYDRYDNEVGIFADSIMKASAPVYKDDVEKARVELHLHTKMSAMDSVIETDKVIERAASWGQKAIAITDHGVVQSFPDALDAGKKYGVKILYGVECYLIDDSVKILSRDCDASFNDTLVAVDIETTSLSPLTGTIIEFGAVKIRGGQIIESFSELVDPGKAIGETTTNLTGITNDMLTGKRTIAEVMPDFLEFIGDAPLIAHNANFDYNFIQYECEKLGLKLNNVYIDTLELSKLALDGLKKFKLDTIAKHLNINMGSHHRATDDANTCGMIFIKIAEQMKNEGYTKLSDFNLKYTQNDYKKVNSYHAVILVKTQAGMKNLYKIISESHLNYFYKRPRVPKRILQEYREGLIIGSACEAGELYDAVISGASHDKLLEIASFYDYLEIQPLGNNRFMLDNGTVNSMEEIKNFNRVIIDLAKEQDKLYVATCDAHFLDPEDKIYRAIIQAG